MIKLAFTLLLGYSFMISCVRASTLDELCGAISTIANCQTSISLPSIAVVYGQVPFVKRNPCKSRISYGFGWTCFPGFDKSEIRAPTGVRLTSRPVAVCDLARSLLPRLDQIVIRATGICKCLPRAAAQFQDPEAVKTFFSSQLTSGSIDSLQRASTLGVCFADAAMEIQDNRQGLTINNGQLRSTSNVEIFRAAELDLSRYISFAVVIAPCTAGACDVEQMSAWLLDYLTDSEKLILDQIKALSDPWVKSVTTIQAQFLSLGNSTKTIVMGAVQARKQASVVIDNICGDPGVCADNTLAQFKTQVLSLFDLSQQINEVQIVISSTAADVEGIVDIIQAADKAFDSIGEFDVLTIIDKIRTGEIKEVRDLAGAVKAAQELPKIIAALQSNVPKLQTALVEAEAKVPAFLDGIQQIFARNWMSDYTGSEQTAEKLTASVKQVQSLVAQFIPQATEAWSSVQTLVTAIGSVGGTLDPGQLDIGVASYQRWSEGSFDFVCTGTRQKKYSIFGFTGSFGVPDFRACLQEYNIPFPNHHVPYLRLRIPEDSILAKLVAGISPATPTTITTVAVEASQTSTQPALPSTTDFSTTSNPEPTATDTGGASQTTFASGDSTVTSEGPTSTNEPFSDPTITAAPFSAIPRRLRRQEATVAEESEDPNFFIAVPTGLYTDESAAQSAEPASGISSVLFYETQIAGQIVTASVGTTPSGAPTATEIAPDPSPSSTIDIGSIIAVYPTLTENALQTIITILPELNVATANFSTPTSASATVSAATGTASMTGTGAKVGAAGVLVAAPVYIWISLLFSLGTGIMGAVVI